MHHIAGAQIELKILTRKGVVKLLVLPVAILSDEMYLKAVGELTNQFAINCCFDVLMFMEAVLNCLKTQE